MDSSLKQRLVGAAVLVALAVIFLPMLVKGPAPDSGVTDVSTGIPEEPHAGSGTRSVDLPLTAPGAPPQGGVVGMPAVEAGAIQAPSGDAALSAVAAGDYAVNFGSYASAADAEQVIAALASAKLPAYREASQANGREVQRVRIGPFADRAVAESARLRAGKVNDKVQARVVALDAAGQATAATLASAKQTNTPESQPAKVDPPKSLQTAPLPVAVAPAVKPAAPTSALATQPVAPPPVAVAKPAADTSKTGFAVQVGAFASATDATTLRDKLRSAGFNAFTDTVTTDKGVLTRVRVGPAMNRAEADALKVSVKAKLGLDGMVRPHP